VTADFEAVLFVEVNEEEIDEEDEDRLGNPAAEAESWNRDAVPAEVGRPKTGTSIGSRTSWVEKSLGGRSECRSSDLFSSTDVEEGGCARICVEVKVVVAGSDINIFSKSENIDFSSLASAVTSTIDLSITRFRVSHFFRRW